MLLPPPPPLVLLPPPLLLLVAVVKQPLSRSGSPRGGAVAERLHTLPVRVNAIVGVPNTRIATLQKKMPPHTSPYLSFYM